MNRTRYLFLAADVLAFVAGVAAIVIAVDLLQAVMGN